MEIELKMQMNFLNKLKRSRKGDIETLREKLDIIEDCLDLIHKDNKKYFRGVLATQLRILICDNHTPLLKRLYPNIKLPKLANKFIELHDGLKVESHGMIFNLSEEYIDVDTWLNQKIMFYNRTKDDVPITIEEEFFEQILNTIQQDQKKSEFKNYYELKSIREYSVYCLKENSDKEKIFNMLEEINYNSITIRGMIKLIANKEGAHADAKHPIGLIMVKGINDTFEYIDQIGKLISVQARAYIEEEISS